MKKFCILAFILSGFTFMILSFRNNDSTGSYFNNYTNKLDEFKQTAVGLLETIENNELNTKDDITQIKESINKVRMQLKGMDFWFRYFEPNAYKKINGPMPVEWETEVFEKFEKPYKRVGAGLTLATLYLEEPDFTKDSLLALINSLLNATETYGADSITKNLRTASPFYFCNRLYLLNLAAIYSTGFECPDTSRIIPELRSMLVDVADTYRSFNESFPGNTLGNEYLSLYDKLIDFVKNQPDNFSRFDHFSFIKKYVNPLFKLNQQAIIKYNMVSRSFVDYSINKTASSIFSKELYNGQNAKGIFLRVEDENALLEIDRLGKLLFYDPILSGNNQRSCASCHKPTEYFNDSISLTSLQYDRKSMLPRNTPSLVNSVYNHLLMLDGQHISLQNQTKAVITNAVEMDGNEKEVMQKILNCAEYKKSFQKLLRYTPGEDEISFDHIISAITFYYSKFSRYTSSFDDAINTNKSLPKNAMAGFNIFMSKAQCATCHFVPQFNGVKPPYVGSEFEVLGVPEDTTYKKISNDKGRYAVNPATETLNAFRTGSLRNAEHTGPYMHNGIFRTLNEVIDFYDAGGGIGKGLVIPNQTLSSDSLHLTAIEKKQLLAFLHSLNENIIFEPAPAKLPLSNNTKLNRRKIGGLY